MKYMSSFGRYDISGVSFYMKNIRIIEFVLTVLVISTLASCQNSSKDALPENNVSGSSNVNQTSFDYMDTFYDCMEKNPIDLNYKTEMDAGVKNISELTDTYTLSWIKEFDYTLSKCGDILSDDKSQEIISLLSEWKKTQQSIWEWQKKEIFENLVSAYGTQKYYDEWKAVGDEYREKTIWLKRQLYIVETAENPQMQINELQSVKFS